MNESMESLTPDWEGVPPDARAFVMQAQRLSRLRDQVDWVEAPPSEISGVRWGRVIEGFAMEPALRPNDVAIFKNRDWEVGHIVHAMREGKERVLQIRREEGVVVLAAIHPAYRSVPIEGWTVKGVCVGYVRNGSDGCRTLREFPHGMRWKMEWQRSNTR